MSERVDGGNGRIPDDWPVEKAKDDRPSVASILADQGSREEPRIYTSDGTLVSPGTTTVSPGTTFLRNPAQPDPGPEVPPEAQTNTPGE